MTDITSLPVINENVDNDENSQFVEKILNDLNDNPNNNNNESMAPMNEMDQLAELDNDEFNYDGEDNLEDYLEDDNNFNEEMNEEMDEDNIYSDNYKIDGGSSDLMTKIKIPIIIAIISLLVNNIKVDELLLGVSFFNSEGSVNMFGLLLKALMVGGIFYVVNTYILNN